MLCKMGVFVDKLDDNIRRVLDRIDLAVITVTGVEAVITSTNDSVHSNNSLHYTNRAIDIRCRTKKINDLLDALRRALGPYYDVVYEQDHIHIEYDPKKQEV